MRCSEQPETHPERAMQAGRPGRPGIPGIGGAVAHLEAHEWSWEAVPSTNKAWVEGTRLFCDGTETLGELQRSYKDCLVMCFAVPGGYNNDFAAFGRFILCRSRWKCRVALPGAFVVCCDIESDTSRQTPLRRFIPLSFVFVCLMGRRGATETPPWTSAKP